MKSIDYIIPISNSGNPDFMDRVDNLNFVLKTFLSNQTQVKLTVYLIDQIINPLLPKFSDHIIIPEGLNVTIKLVTYGTFCKPWLYNIGIRISNSDYIILGDLDNWTDIDYFKDLISFVDDNKLKWCFAWNKLIKLSKEQKENLIYRNILELNNETHYPCHPECGGDAGNAILFKRDFLSNELHGVNELFIRWGWEDSELIFRAYKYSNTHLEYPITTFHLWHEISIYNMYYTYSGKRHNDTKEFNELLYIFVKNNYVIMNNILKDQVLGHSEYPIDIEKTIEKYGII